MTPRQWKTSPGQQTGAGTNRYVGAVVKTAWWPGITEPWCEHCTWSFLDGVHQVKLINRACAVHGRALGR